MQQRPIFGRQLAGMFCSIALALASGPCLASEVSALEPMVSGLGNAIPGAIVPNKILQTVQGKGEPVNLPSLGRSNPGVVLWDELPSNKDAGSENIQTGGLNVQHNNMLSIR